MQLSYENVGDFCSRIDLSQPRPLINLSDVTFIQPFALVYLGMFLRLHNSEGTNFDVAVPREQFVREYLATQNFWERFNFDPDIIETEKLHRFTSATSLNDIVDIENRPYIGEDIASLVRELLIKTEIRVDVDEIEELVSELIDNFERHSTNNLAVFTMQGNPRRLVIAIGDCGIGIRASLIQNPRHGYLANRPHYEAIRKAFEPLVSAKPEGGTGLTDAKSTIGRYSGTLTLMSGNGYFRLTSDGREIANRASYDLPGVQIELTIPITR